MLKTRDARVTELPWLKRWSQGIGSLSMRRFLHLSRRRQGTSTEPGPERPGEEPKGMDPGREGNSEGRRVADKAV